MGSIRMQQENSVRCRVGVVGDSGVGKTSLVTRFLGKEFDQVSSII